MKLNKWIGMSVLGLIVSLSAIGCKSTPPAVTKLPDQNPQTPVANSGLPPGTPLDHDKDAVGKNKDGDGKIPLDGPGHPGWKENSDAFKAYTVHFDYDSTVIKDTEKTKLEAIASQLKSAPSAAVKIEGHCDERGTEEYNRSLGERRALALREELARMGVEPNRLDTISYGDIKPLVVGHDETSWRQNRRGEFVQLTPP
jgi:peptidoglycan-associated lipoprotein